MDCKHTRTRLLPALLFSALALFAVALLAAAGASHAKTITVDAAGGGDHTTIQEAVDAAEAGDLIEVKNGNYQENVVVGKELTLVGESNTLTVIDTQGEGVAVKVAADKVNVTGFKFHIGSDFVDRGIEAKVVSNCHFENNVVTPDDNNVPVGFYLEDVNDTQVLNNKVTAPNLGLLLEGSSNTRIAGNEFNDCNLDDMRIRECENLIIEDNQCSNANNRAIALVYTNLSSIQNNVITGCGSDGIDLSMSNQNQIVGNQITDCTNDASFYDYGGIIITDSDKNTLTGNTIKDGGDYGIYLEDSGNHTFRDNTLTGNVENFGLFGIYEFAYKHDLDDSNTAEGKPIYYFSGNSSETIDGSSMDAAYVYLVDCSDLTIHNLTMKESWKGLFVAFSSDLTIRDCELSENADGLYLWYVTDSDIIDCNMKDNTRHGVFARGVENCSFQGCEVKDNADDGIRFVVYSYWNTISGSEISGGDTGVMIDDSSYTTVEDCNITDHASNGVSINGGHHNTVQGSMIEGVTGGFFMAGVHIQDSDSNTVKNTNISSVEGSGVWLLRADHNNINNNVIKDNEIGVNFGFFLDDGMENNLINNNNIYDNSEYGINADSNGEKTVNAKNNYWGADNGPSGEGSGSGDKITDYVDSGDYLKKSIFDTSGDPGEDPGEDPGGEDDDDDDGGFLPGFGALGAMFVLAAVCFLGKRK